MDLIAVLAAAARAQMRPRMLALVLVPLLGALLLWILVYALAWHSMVDGLRQLAEYGAAKRWISDSVAHVIGEWVVTITMLLLLLPLTQATAVIVTSTIAMPIMLDDVAQRDFPQLERRRFGTVLGSIFNALGAVLVYAGLWILTLPLWLFGVPALVLPVLLNGWLNARLFRYDALADHADAREYAQLKRSDRLRWIAMGAVAALLQLVPLVSLVMPVYSGLCFIYLGLGDLQRMRARVPAAR